MVEKNKIIAQAKFCKELMIRLDDDVESAPVVCGMFEKRTTMANDITRLRRELNELSKMLLEW